MKYCSLLLIAVMMLISGSCDDDDDDTPGTEEKTVSLNLIADGLVSPLVLVESPDNSGRLFVVDQPGQIYIIKNGTRISEPFLNIQGKIVTRESPQDERGLLGLAFHPQFAANGRFYVYYSAPLSSTGPEGWSHTNYVAEYKAPVNGDVADDASERIILVMDHPQANHNAGMIAFGQDGYLYISTGDGGGGDDVGLGHEDDWYPENGGGNAQNIEQNLLGKILRIDVNPETGYLLPPDNPFIDKEGLDEIYAFGFRNPYRFSFNNDGQVILADAGQELYEEIDLVTKGGNYGWNVKEGAHCFSTADPNSPPEGCPVEDVDGNPLIDPVIEFKNSKTATDGLGNVSIGGYIYRGDSVSVLKDQYLFGVLTQKPGEVNGAIFTAEPWGATWKYEKLLISNMENGGIGMYVLGFGQDAQGEVYVLTNGGSENSGSVYKIGK